MTAHRVFLFFLTLATAVALAPVLKGLVSSPAYDDDWLPAPQSFSELATVERRVRVLGYERHHFGDGWASASTNFSQYDLPSSCTTRDVMVLSQATHVDQSDECGARSGEIFDPYSLDRLSFSPGSRSVELDHVFPLSAAWDMGAYEWDNSTRLRFANDPLNLVATSRLSNQEKSDKLPSEWMPPAPRARCWYARRVAAVAHSYGLALAQADIRAMSSACRWQGFLESFGLK